MNFNIMIWYDKKVVSFISTFMNFESELINTEKPKVTDKPSMIKNYDKIIDGVDSFDKMLHSYFNERKSRKYTSKFAIYMINLLLHN
jgi:hypothetical protein